MNAKQCLECGAALPAPVAGGLCSVCALRGALGAQFGEYELLDEIARGGMGVVYRARQMSLNRIVAIKMLLPGLSSPESLQRFRTEASTAAALHHPHIVAIHDVGDWCGQPYIVMDYVEGASLAQRIAEAGGRTPDFVQAARWLKAVAEAVQCAHDYGILHRDLKPSNVLIDEQGQPRVTDFGLAKRVGDRSQLTLSGQALGSPSYMPPEQTEGGGGKVSRRSDIYGLGATLYHLLTGRAPFEGETPTDVLHRVLTSAPAAPRALNAAIPRDLETVCLKCLEKDPGRRYASAQMVAEELGRFLDGRPTVARPVSAPEKLRRRLRQRPLQAALASVAIVSLVVAGWFGWQASVSSRQLAQERMQRAIDAALAAAWAGNRAAVEQAIAQAERNGAPAERIGMTRGQAALYSLRVDEAVAEFERAVALAPGSVPARAMLANAYLWRGELDRYAAMLEQLEGSAPVTPEDYLSLGSAFTMGHPDTSKAVSLLEVAKQQIPSGMTFLLLGMAEGFHALDTGSWPTALKAMDHCDWGRELLGPDHPELLAPVLSAFNAALRLCPVPERARVEERAAAMARALESVPNPYGRVQRAFYFENNGNADAELAEWQKAITFTRVGLTSSWYAAAMLQHGKSEEALEVLKPAGPYVDPVAAVARAYLLLDLRRPDEADTQYRQAADRQGASRVLAETILLLSGARARVAANAMRLLEAVSPAHPDYQVLRYWAGQASAKHVLESAGASRVAQCRAHYLLGVSRLAANDHVAARQHFERCVETGLQPVTEYQWSHAFLVRLKGNAQQGNAQQGNAQ